MEKINRRRNRRGGTKKFMRPEKGRFKAKTTSSLSNLRAPNWNNLNLEPFQKNFYREHPNVMNRLRVDVERFRNKHEITVQGLALNPIESFDEVFMPDYVAREIRNQGYNRPTPIQSQTWPIAFSGYNLVGIAQTGSGKTLAYILPAIVHINNQTNIKPGDGPIAVVLAPTRELAVQIQQVAIDFGSSTSIRTVCTVGGVDKKPQEADLLKGCEIVVATPGRLLDFLSSNVTNMKRCTYLVLDEADRMLDMGFEAQIRQIISQIRPDKQILMWSATWPLEIRRLAEDFLGHYIQVNIGSLELSANHNIKQFVHICLEKEKSAKLQLLLRQIYQANNPGKILIFVSKKKRADMISKYINNFGVACESLHGDKPQSQRTKILDDFRSNRSNIIVATDVAARGLDVDGIMYVINLDFPKLIEDYVHRIGRCGRCDRMGISYAFFTANDAKQANDLIAILNEANQPVDAKLQEIASNPIKPEKIDKKQRRLNENSGFNVPVPVPEKRRHDGRNVNISGPGPSSSTSVRDSFVGEPDTKRDRIAAPEQSGRGMMIDRNNFMGQSAINRGYKNIPATVCNPDQMDDLGIGRTFDSRNNDRFESDDRVMNRDFMDDGPIADRRLMELRRREFERTMMSREPAFPDDGIMNEYRMDGQASNDRQRFPSAQFDRRSDAAIGLNRMSNIRDNMYDQRESDFDRLENDFNRSGQNFDRRGTAFGLRTNDFDRRESDLDRRESDFGRRGNDFDRHETDFGRRELNFDRNQSLSINDFDDRSNDRMLRDSFDDIRGPIRDGLLDGGEHGVNRMRPFFDSSVSDRRNYEREMIGNRDVFETRATNFQENLKSRTFDMLSDRRSVSSQEFRPLSPNPMLDRSNINADRFLNQSRDDDAYDSLHQFGRRRDDFRELTQDSGYGMSDRHSDFIDENNRGQPASNRWNNDFAGRAAQDRRNFNSDSRRQNDFGLGGEMNFNFARNNDYANDESQNRNRRDFERRNVDGRFNRFD